MNPDEEIYRLRNALDWIRILAGIHYFGEAYDPEHMRSIANIAAEALNGKQFPDFIARVELAKARARKLADELGFLADPEEGHDG